MGESVSIRPEVSILSVLRHLNYDWWFALAEFVDNALASFAANRDVLATEGCERLEVFIERTGPDQIKIRDNAAGIRRNDLDRALKAAAVPPDRTGLSEFGMGMKSAACWCGRRWSLHTSALGETSGYSVEMDVQRIVDEARDTVEVEVQDTDARAHFTVITVSDVDAMPMGRTVGKIRDHLRDIYRHFLRDGILQLTVFGDELEYQTPEILHAPCVVPGHETKNSVPWKAEVDLSLPDGRQVTGWVAIRNTGSQSEAGLSLFRRNRVVMGSYDTKYRPQTIFGSRNSYRSQRLFGELHLHGFEATHTKDGIRWGGAETELLEQLKKLLSAKDFPLLRQADEYRARASKEQIKAATDKAIQRQGTSLRRTLPASVDCVSRAPVVAEPSSSSLPKADLLSERTLTFLANEVEWTVTVQTLDDPSYQDLFEVGISKSEGPSSRSVTIRIAMLHPFVVQWADTDVDKLELLIRMVVAFGVAEELAVSSGGSASAMRRRFNELVRSGLELA